MWPRHYVFLFSELNPTPRSSVWAKCTAALVFGTMSACVQGFSSQGAHYPIFRAWGSLWQAGLIGMVSVLRRRAFNSILSPPIKSPHHLSAWGLESTPVCVCLCMCESWEGGLQLRSCFWHYLIWQFVHSEIRTWIFLVSWVAAAAHCRCLHCTQHLLVLTF